MKNNKDNKGTHIEVEITNPDILKKVSEAKKLKDSGLTNAQISEKMKLSPSRVGELLRGINRVKR